MEKRVLLIQSSEQDSKKRRLEESGAATIHNIFNPSSLCLSNLMLEIVHRFETFDILQLAQVCRKFKILFYHQRIWKHLCPPEIILLNSSRNYRIVFKGILFYDHPFSLRLHNQEFMSTSKLLLMPLLSFRKGGQVLLLTHKFIQKSLKCSELTLRSSDLTNVIILQS